LYSNGNDILTLNRFFNMLLTEEIAKSKIKSAIESLAGNLPLDSESTKNIIARAKGLPEKIEILNSTYRLMPLAEKAILEEAKRGQSHYSCACWWARSLVEARGRMKRKWWSPEGGLYLCISLFPQLLRENRNLYSISAGLSACQTLHHLGFDSEIRWVNDVLISGKKVCGILMQSVFAQQTGEEYILIGIGMNINNSSFPRDIRKISTSLHLESGKKWPIWQIGTDLIARTILNVCILHEWEGQCLRNGLAFDAKTNPIISLYETLSKLNGRRVVFGRDLEKEKGTPCVSRGITYSGALILESLGEIFTVDSGEIRFQD